MSTQSSHKLFQSAIGAAALALLCAVSTAQAGDQSQWVSQQMAISDGSPYAATEDLARRAQAEEQNGDAAASNSVESKTAQARADRQRHVADGDTR